VFVVDVFVTDVCVTDGGDDLRDEDRRRARTSIRPRVAPPPPSRATRRTTEPRSTLRAARVTSPVGRVTRRVRAR